MWGCEAGQGCDNVVEGPCFCGFGRGGQERVGGGEELGGRWRCVQVQRKQGGKQRESRRKQHTSATGAESSVSVATLGANADHLAVNILGVVGVDVAGAAAAVGYFGGARHFFFVRDDGLRDRW